MAQYFMPIMPAPAKGRVVFPIPSQPAPGGNRFVPMPVAKPTTPSLVYTRPVLPGRAPVKFQLPIMAPIKFQPMMRK